MSVTVVDVVSSRSAAISENPSLEGTRGADLECPGKVGLAAVDGVGTDWRGGVSVPAAKIFAVGFRSRPEERACAGGGGGMPVEGFTSADEAELGVQFDRISGGAISCGALDWLEVRRGCSLARSSGVASDVFDGEKLLAFKVAGSFHVSRFSDRPAESGPVPRTEGANWLPVGLA